MKKDKNQIDFPKIKRLLKKYQLTGWLIYQCQGTYEVGLNPIANEVCQIKELITRPWFCYLSPNRQKPAWICQAMEREKFARFSGEKIVYSDRNSLKDSLKTLLPQRGQIAMEITKKANIPLLSRVDFGTISLIKSLTQAQIVSSQDITGAYLSFWGHQGLSTHKKAVAGLESILRQVKEKVRQNLGRITDYKLQQYIEVLYQKEGLITIYHPVVAVGKDTGNPHYFPSSENPKVIGPDQLLLVDIWGKTKDKGAVFADITTMFYTGQNIPLEFEKAWQAQTKARDYVLNYLIKYLPQKTLKGNQIDKIGRKIITKAGYGENFVHRLGHNLASELHGYGPNFDDYETIDNRDVLLDTGYSIEPAIYTAEFGVRSEINIYVSTKGKVTLTTPKPKKIERIINGNNKNTRRSSSRS